MAYETAIPAMQQAEIDLPVKVYDTDQDWTDRFALSRCTQDFDYAERYRTLNHDWRWRNADELYLAWVQQKYWEGTRIPRSSIGVFLTFEQIESLLPKVVGEIFSEGDRFFDVEPNPNSTYQQARAVQELVAAQLRGSHEFPQESIREVIRRHLKSAFTYGNGIVRLDWLAETVKRKRLFRVSSPVRRSVSLLNIGIKAEINIPTGQFRHRIVEKEYDDTRNRPQIKYVSLKDFYIDPNCPSTVCQEARYCIERDYVSIDELRKAAENDERIKNLPDDAGMMALSNAKPFTQGDWTKSSTELLRSGYWQPNIDQTSDPGGKRIERLRYVTKDRMVWVLNRRLVVYNEHNDYGFINYYNYCYTDVLDRFYGIAVSDVLEGEQRLMQSTINARVDEMSLSIHRPMIKRRGVTIPAYQLRRRPGQMVETDDPSTDIKMEDPSNVTQQAYVEVTAAEQRAQRYTGITDLAVLGAAAVGGNSANRTAAGINTQAAASQSRIEYLVENYEDILLEPLLGGVHTLNKRFLDPNQAVAMIGQDGGTINLDPLDIMNSEVNFIMQASARMKTRRQIQSALPLIAQTVMNPEFLQMLAQQQQMTVDVQEMANILGDATGYRFRGELFRKLTQQEMQAMNQPSQDNQTSMQMQSQRLEAQQDMTTEKLEHDTVKEVIKAGLQHVQAIHAIDSKPEPSQRG